MLGVGAGGTQLVEPPKGPRPVVVGQVAPGGKSSGGRPALGVWPPGGHVEGAPGPTTRRPPCASNSAAPQERALGPPTPRALARACTDPRPGGRAGPGPCGEARGAPARPPTAQFTGKHRTGSLLGMTVWLENHFPKAGLGGPSFPRLYRQLGSLIICIHLLRNFL